MHVFLVGPKGRIAAKVKEYYEPSNWEQICSIPDRPYFLYRVDEETNVNEVEAVKIFKARNNPWLMEYSNGDKTYFEDIYLQNILVQGESGNPVFFLNDPPEIVINLGHIFVFVIFLGLSDENGPIERSLFSIDEIEALKMLILDYVEKEKERREDISKKN